MQAYLGEGRAQEIFRAPGPDGKIAHAQMRIGDSVFFLADEDPSIPSGYRSPQTLSGTSCIIYMYVPDADALFDQAVRAGAESLAWDAHLNSGVRPFCFCSLVGDQVAGLTIQNLTQSLQGGESDCFGAIVFQHGQVHQRDVDAVGQLRQCQAAGLQEFIQVKRNL